jgi:hypothetical protein
MQWSGWRQHFELNRTRVLPENLERLDEIPVAWRGALASSLARCQLNESGEGRIVHEVDSARLPSIDADYRAALKLFVAEEGRHARILGYVVRGLGGRLLTHTWTAHLFAFARRLMGLRLKLLVLLAAEVVGSGLYGLLASRLPDSPLRRALEELREDERHHLRFHGDFFARQGWGPAMRLASTGLWWTLVLAASGLMLLDHRHTLRVLGIGPLQAARTFLALTVEAARRIQPECARGSAQSSCVLSVVVGPHVSSPSRSK